MIKFVFTMIGLQIIAVVVLAALAGLPPAKIPQAAALGAAVIAISSMLAKTASNLEKRRKKNHDKAIEKVEGKRAGN